MAGALRNNGPATVFSGPIRNCSACDKEAGKQGVRAGFARSHTLFSGTFPGGLNSYTYSTITQEAALRCFSRSFFDRKELFQISGHGLRVWSAELWVHAGDHAAPGERAADHAQALRQGPGFYQRGARRQTLPRLQVRVAQ